MLLLLIMPRPDRALFTQFVFSRGKYELLDKSLHLWKPSWCHTKELFWGLHMKKRKSMACQAMHQSLRIITPKRMSWKDHTCMTSFSFFSAYSSFWEASKWFCQIAHAAAVTIIKVLFSAVCPVAWAVCDKVRISLVLPGSSLTTYVLERLWLGSGSAFPARYTLTQRRQLLLVYVSHRYWTKMRRSDYFIQGP